jgi:hypothetical protein
MFSLSLSLCSYFLLKQKIEEKKGKKTKSQKSIFVQEHFKGLWIRPFVCMEKSIPSISAYFLSYLFFFSFTCRSFVWSCLRLYVGLGLHLPRPSNFLYTVSHTHLTLYIERACAIHVITRDFQVGPTTLISIPTRPQNRKV